MTTWNHDIRKQITVFGNRLQVVKVVDQAVPKGDGDYEMIKLVMYRNYGDGKNWKPKVATVADWKAWDKNSRKGK